MSRKLGALMALSLAACGRDAMSDREVLSPRDLCDGCTLELPSGSGPVPLLVVLHGNHETAKDAGERWRAAARERGWGVLALQCPRDRGCDDVGRWYRWRGHPSWVVEQTHEIGRDRSRMVLVGWSGGASYIGMMAPYWQRDFDAVVFHGGGQPPKNDDACPALPAYFLVGNKNPAHDAAVRLHEYWQRCGVEARWDLLEGANHAAEEAALDEAKVHAILDWIDRKQTAHGRGFAFR